MEQNYYEECIVKIRETIQNGQLKEAEKLLEEELSMPYIPALYEERFKEIYRELSYKEKEAKEFVLSRDKIREILENNEDKNIIILAIVEMCKLNIRDFIDSIQIFFSRKLRNIYKVMIIDALRSQGVNFVFDLNNEGEIIKINPSTSENVLESEDYSIIKKILEDNIGKKDPNLLSLATENLMLYLSEIYPKKVAVSDYETLAYCIHLFSLRMYGEEVNDNELGLIYNIDKEKEEKMLLKLQTACSI